MPVYPATVKNFSVYGPAGLEVGVADITLVLAHPVLVFFDYFQFGVGLFVISPITANEFSKVTF